MEAGGAEGDEASTSKGGGRISEEADEEAPSSPPPAGLTAEEYKALRGTIARHHTYQVADGECSSLLSQRVSAPAAAVWSLLRRFDRPQVYKHFVHSCALKGDGDAGGVKVGCLREVRVISGLPASTSTERLDVLDDENHVVGFSIIGGEHRLRNYRSVTTVREFQRPDDGDRDDGKGEIWSVVLESYSVDVPEGNTEEDTRLFADTVVRLNLQQLASVSEAITAKETAAVVDDDEEQLHGHRSKKKKSAPTDDSTTARGKP